MHDFLCHHILYLLGPTTLLKAKTMQSLLKTIHFLIITCCLFTFGASNVFAENKESTAPDMNAMMGMMDPAMYMNMMNPMMSMMNPAMYSNMMYPMMGMGAPMMGSMMNPMMGMNMMNPMMGMMGPMSGMGMPGMPPSNVQGNNPMGQIMDPKQYEQWFNQWTEMMKNFSPQSDTKSK